MSESKKSDVRRSARVLVVDDDPDFRELVRVILQGEHEVVEADGAEAACVVNVDPKESDVARVARPQATAATQTAPARRPRPMAHALAAVLLGFLLAESLLARRR